MPTSPIGCGPARDLGALAAFLLTGQSSRRKDRTRWARRARARRRPPRRRRRVRSPASPLRQPGHLSRRRPLRSRSRPARGAMPRRSSPRRHWRTRSPPARPPISRSRRSKSRRPSAGSRPSHCRRRERALLDAARALRLGAPRRRLHRPRHPPGSRGAADLRRRRQDGRTGQRPRARLGPTRHNELRNEARSATRNAYLCGRHRGGVRRDRGSAGLAASRRLRARPGALLFILRNASEAITRRRLERLGGSQPFGAFVARYDRRASPFSRKPRL